MPTMLTSHMTHRRARLMFLLTLLLASGLLWQSCAPESSPHAHSSPRLAVLLVIDQMTPEYITRLDTFYQFGFRRLLDNGAVFVHGKHDHAMTATAPGHATIATGTHPSLHGITGNDYYNRSTFSRVYNSIDSAVTIVPHPEDAPMSPHNLLQPALGDWLKEKSPRHKVFGVALKDRSAIMTAGKRADAAYWYYDKTGDFVTSTHYMKSLPAWASRFNASNASETYRDSVWNAIGPETMCNFCSPDSFAAEFDGIRTTFPHTYHQHEPGIDSTYRQELTRTPFGDHFTLEFAESLVVHEQLGADNQVDLLCVSLSAADITGHAFGPDSHEMNEFYLRLDRYLGDFLAFLDAKIGKDRYLIALSSDHAVLPLPEFLKLQGVPAERVPSKEYQDSVSAALQTLDVTDLYAGELKWKLFGSSLTLDSSVLSVGEVKAEQIRLRMAEKLRTVPFISDVFTWGELRSETPLGRPFESMYRHNFHPERMPDLMVRTKEYYLITSSPTGTTHGSPYNYDSYVPIIFYGPEIMPQRFADTILTVDIAPTLGKMLDAAVPATVNGKNLSEQIGLYSHSH